MSEHSTSQLATLIQLGKEQGYLTYAEINDQLPESVTESDQIDDLSLIHISEPTRRLRGSRMPSSA